MSVLDAGKAWTFSEMKLQLTFNGSPAAGAKVVRTVEWHSPRTDEFVADEQGHVTLPEVRERSMTQLLPVEFVVAQDVKVYFNEQEYEIWINGKRNPDENSELGGKPLVLQCEITDELEDRRDFGTLLFTNCKW